jgi:nicotinamide-nucleotide amidase
MFAEIIAVGSEMLTPQKTDTNSLWLTQELNDAGVEVAAKTIIGDDRARLSDAVRTALGRTEIVIVTGGLGPTEDDVTREAVAQALGRTLHFDEKICSTIEERFRRFGRTMVEINRRQAFVIEGAEVLPNDRGTAPGQWIALGEQGRLLMLLPGPPGELKAMWERECRWRLRARLPEQVIRILHWRVAGMPESDLDQLISPVYTRYANPVTTILAAAGDIQIHLRARAATADEADRLLSEVADQIEPLLGEKLYSKDGRGLDECVIAGLRQRGETIAVAESATGGLVAQRLTSVAGSSAAFIGGFLTYTDASKASLLGVSEAVLKNYGAVSEPVAHSMAIGARERFGSDYALSVTGYAGPEGGTQENPVGTIFVGLATKDAVEVRRFRFPGDRARVRSFAAHAALDLLRRRLLR